MKTSLFTILISFILGISVFAKGIPVEGQWVLTTVEEDGKTMDVYSMVEFSTGGILLMDEMEIGTWSFDAKEKLVTITSERVKEFAGKRNFNSVGKNAMFLETEGSKINFIKYDKSKVTTTNQKSGLIGSWKIKGQDGDKYLFFEAPDKLTIGYADLPGNITHGTWMFLKDKNAVIIMARERSLSGENSIKSVTAESFVMIHDKNEMTAVKEQKSGVKKEILDFTEDEIAQYNENTVEYAFPEEEKLPWRNSQNLLEYYKLIERLTYQKSELIPELKMFITTEIVTSPATEVEYREIQMDEIFERLSSYQIENNYFFPMEISNYIRISKDMEVTVPAGTFNCTVVETADSFNDSKIRMYMVKNRPGIYAKVVISGKDFDKETYTVYELAELKGDFKEQSNKEIIGKWLLVNIQKEGKIEPMSQEYEFISDGRVAVNSFDYTAFLKWDYNDENKSLTFETDGDKSAYTIIELNENKMILKNEESTFNYVKFDLSKGHLQNKNSGLIGYWILTNTADEYQTIHLDSTDSWSSFNYYLRAPIQDNQFEKRGKWLYNQKNSSLIFNTPDEMVSIRGEYKVLKKTEDLLIMDNKSNQARLLKIDEDKVTNNNAKLNIEGKTWKYTKKDGGSVYFKFDQPFEFYYGRESKDDLMHLGAWMYNPETKILFVGSAVHYISGEHTIVNISDTSIEFRNGMKLDVVE